MKLLLQNSTLLVLLVTALLLSPGQGHTETFRGVVIDVDKKNGRMTVTPEQNTGEFSSPVFVELPQHASPHGQRKRVSPQCTCKGKSIVISGSFSTQQPDLFIATKIFRGNQAHIKDRTGVRQRLGRCRQLTNDHTGQPSF